MISRLLANPRFLDAVHSNNRTLNMASTQDGVTSLSTWKLITIQLECILGNAQTKVFAINTPDLYNSGGLRGSSRLGASIP